MEGVSPLPDEDIGVAEYNAQGWPRGLSLQLTRNLQTSRNGVPNSSRPETRTDTQGVQIDAYLETPDFGALSIHALALGGRGSSSLTNWNLRQTGLPFDGGWRADNALGTTNLLVPELSRRNSRLALPTPQVLGGSSVWRNPRPPQAVARSNSAPPPRLKVGITRDALLRPSGMASSV